ncbi:MAG: hypothetical protein R6V07_03945 [Armatimonadota bacterium]
MRRFAVPLILSLALACAHAQPEALLHAAESLDGVSIGMGSGYDESKLFLSHAAEHVTEGAAAIGAVSRSPEDAQGNVYVSVFVPIEPTSFTDRALVFDGATSTPDRSQALYVRGYDESGRMVMSWMSWEGQLSAEVRQFRLVPEVDGALRWEPGRIEADDRSAVTRIEFITGTGEKGVYFNVTIDNIRASIAR